MSKMQNGPVETMPPKLDKDAVSERIQIVAPPSWIRRLDDWRRSQEKIPSRSDAIRQIVDFGLAKLKDGKK